MIYSPRGATQPHRIWLSANLSDLLRFPDSPSTKATPRGDELYYDIGMPGLVL